MSSAGTIRGRGASGSPLGARHVGNTIVLKGWGQTREKRWGTNVGDGFGDKRHFRLRLTLDSDGLVLLRTFFPFY
jgi:hypothetical protein